ncbi:MAG TPA: hypothetical protein VM183_06730, partial [Burkholderiales bacterium]|nr:hypothetical protein [Burkholderiales bacterium]
MADTIFTRALTRAADIQGSTQALASLLRVPENTLSRWTAGRAQMPLQAFLHVIELLMQEEQKGHEARLQDVAEGETLTFHVGELPAHCASCDCNTFVPAEPTRSLRFSTELACCSCGERVVHGNLIAALAKDAVYQSRAMSAARARRQSALRASA